jgi:hypothetical protein
MSDLLPLLKALSARRARLYADMRAAGPEVYNWAPAPGEWSEAQVTEHLFKVERRVLVALRENMKTMKPGKGAGIFSGIRHAVFCSVMRRPVKVKAPVKAILPADAPDIDKLEREWDGLSAEWGEFIENFDPALLKSAAFQHPIFGWFNVTQTLQFMVEHFDHHRHQLKRIREAPGYPGKSSAVNPS